VTESDNTIPARPGTQPARSDSPTAADSADPSTQGGAQPPSVLFPDGTLPIVPGYTVTHELARGGMGVVYAAHDRTFERRVAVKVMHHGQNGARFVVESKVTAQLPHPGIPPVYALGELADGRPFLAMKLVQGHTLAHELKTADRSGAGGLYPADLPRLIGAFEQICLTVGFAHSRGIAHRDLKPDNVMIGSFGEVLVMDWGLAKQLAREPAAGGEETVSLTGTQEVASETVAGSVKGTPAYMAPEQARGEPVDARADVFALGGLLAVLLTGQPPFGGTTVREIVRKAAREELNDCFERLAGCGADAELVAVARKCLAASPGDRYADGKEVAEAVAVYRAGVEERLRAAERDRAVSAAEAREQRKRRKVQLLLAGAVALLLGALAGFAWWDGQRKTTAARLEAEAARLEGERNAEARNKAEQARAGVLQSLSLAADLRKQFKFDAANKALAQAAELAHGGAPELVPDVERARANLAFVVKLDGIRYRKWTWVAETGGKGEFNTMLAPPEYRKAFAERGLDLPALDTAEAANRITASAVRADLVAAVDDWALYEPNAALRDRLLEIARKADPDPWRDRLRDPATRRDRTALEKLAADADPAKTPPFALGALSDLMRRRELDPLRVLSAARDAHPTDFELAFATARRLLAAGDTQTGPLEAARALRPEVAAVWLDLGFVLTARRDFDGALAATRRAIDLDPDDAAAHNNLGSVLCRTRRFPEAIAALNRALELDPAFAMAHSNLGYALAEMKDFEGGERAMRRAVELNPRSPAALSNLGFFLYGRGKIDEAIVLHERAIDIAPTFANGHTNLGAALAAKRDYPRALAALRRAVALDPTSAVAYCGLGSVLSRMDRDDEAIEAYKRAIALDRKCAPAYAGLAVVLCDRGEFDVAVGLCREALKHDPDEVLAHVTLGIALQNKDDLDGAIAAYKEVLKRQPGHPDALLQIAGLFSDQGKYREAAAYARRAVVADPMSAQAHAVLGTALRQLNDFTGARAALKVATRLDRKWEFQLLFVPPPPVAPPPRAVER
jgi:eukaryotic-like serine/threonine-protein kinase